MIKRFGQKQEQLPSLSRVLQRLMDEKQLSCGRVPGRRHTHALAEAKCSCFDILRTLDVLIRHADLGNLTKTLICLFYACKGICPILMTLE